MANPKQQHQQDDVGKNRELDVSSYFKASYFALYSGFGIAQPYMSLFFQSLGMNKREIGILSMIPNLCSFFLAPIGNMIADAYQASIEVMLVSLVSGSIVSLALLYAGFDFRLLAALVLVSSALKAPITPLLDSLAISSLADASKFGDLRLYGAISFGICSFLGGTLVEANKTAPFRAIFYMQAIFSLIAGLILVCMVDRIEHNSNKSIDGNNSGREEEATGNNKDEAKSSILVRVWRLFMAQPSLLVFAIIVFLSGVGSGVIDAFLFVRLKQIGGSGILLGLSRFLTCAAEVPAFKLAGPLHKRFGVWVMLCFTQIAFCARFTYYSLLREPWAVLPCELLHGITFAVTWSVACTHANEVSLREPGCHSTLQAILEGLHWGLGSGLGSLFAGYLYEQHGAVWLFRMCAFMSACGAFISLLTSFYLPYQPISNENQHSIGLVQLSLTEHSGHVDTSIGCDEED